jgi:hypothetical protein
MVLAHRERLSPSVRPSGMVRATLPRGQDARRPAGPGVYRPAQRGRHPGPAAGRHAERAVRIAGAHGPRRRSPAARATSADAAIEREVEEGTQR